MKAIICTKYGPPEVLQLQEVEKPSPGNNEICVRIHATTVTASDCIVRGFKIPRRHPIGFIMGLVLGFKKPRKPILGMVLAGEIESIGKKVTSFGIGDKVLAWTVSTPIKINLGTYAEYKCLPQTSVIVTKPKNLSFEEAVAIPYGGLLAMHYLNKFKIQKGQKVLIYGASGSIGTSAIQIAKYYKAEVTGVCSTGNMDFVKSLGADRVIDYTKEESSSLLENYDFVLDAVGKGKSSTIKTQCRDAVNPNGKYISVDNGSPRGTIENLKYLKDLAEEGWLNPVIDKIYPLEDMVEAHRYVDGGHKKGNVVITI